MKKILKEPLLHFLLLGITLFAINYYKNPRVEEKQMNNEIVVEPAMVEKIKQQYKKFTGIDATKNEVDSFINNYVAEEIQYREALKAGLDKSDETRTSLIKQLNTASKEMIPIGEPSAKQLENFYNKNIAIFSSSDSGKQNFKDIQSIVKAKFIEAEKEKQLKQKEQILKSQYKIINKYKQP